MVNALTLVIAAAALGATSTFAAPLKVREFDRSELEARGYIGIRATEQMANLQQATTGKNGAPTSTSVTAAAGASVTPTGSKGAAPSKIASREDLVAREFRHCHKHPDDEKCKNKKEKKDKKHPGATTNAPAPSPSAAGAQGVGTNTGMGTAYPSAAPMNPPTRRGLFGGDKHGNHEEEERKKSEKEEKERQERERKGREHAEKERKERDHKRKEVEEHQKKGQGEISQVPAGPGAPSAPPHPSASPRPYASLSSTTAAAAPTPSNVRSAGAVNNNKVGAKVRR